MVTIISHLALTLSCSISFYIYYGKYGAPKQVMNRRLTKIRSLIRLPNKNKYMEGDAEMVTLPDMDNLVENDITLDTMFRETSFRGRISPAHQIFQLKCKTGLNLIEDGKMVKSDQSRPPLLQNLRKLNFSWV